MPTDTITSTGKLQFLKNRAAPWDGRQAREVCSRTCRLALLLDLLGEVVLESNLFDGPQLDFEPIDVLL